MWSTNSGMPIGRIFGIELRLHWSLLIIFAIVLLNLGEGVFPAWHPEWSDSMVWGVALATALLFFASILAHEMAHALVARRYGIPVSSVMLLLFGGVASLEDDPDTPKEEALMAAVGPFVSVGLGIIFVVLASYSVGPVEPGSNPIEMAQHLGPLATIVAWLGPINIFIGLFNLLPGFPLDGGRVLRAALWGLTGNLLRATRWTSAIGQGFGALLMGVGVLQTIGVYFPIIGAGFGAGLWMMLIGWILFGAAIGSYRQLRLRFALEGVVVGSLMRRQLPAPVPATCSIRQWLAEYVMASGAEYSPVVDAEGHTIGIAHASRVRSIPKQRWSDVPVEEVTDRLQPEASVGPSDDAYQSLRKLRRARDARLPVVVDGQLVGMFSLAEVTHWLTLNDPEVADTLDPPWIDSPPSSQHA